MNKTQEADLRKKLKYGELVGENCTMRCELEDAIELYHPVISKWYHTSKIGEYLEIPNLIQQYKNFPEIIYFLHKILRSRFKNLWTYKETGNFHVKHVSQEEYKELVKKCTLEQDILNELIGFRHIFTKIVSLKKPVIGHNLLQDLMIMTNNFETALPQSYARYKRLINDLFPAIYDTKTIYYELRTSIPKEKLAKDTSLEALFKYFKDGSGRHLVVNTSAIESNVQGSHFGHYHDAGWDSFCAGYIFIRMACFNVAQDYPKNKTFVSTEIVSGLAPYKNRVNVIRGSTTHIVSIEEGAFFNFQELKRIIRGWFVCVLMKKMGISLPEIL